MAIKKLSTILLLLLGVVSVQAADYGINFCGFSVTDSNKDDLCAMLRSYGISVNPSSTASYNSSTKTLNVRPLGDVNHNRYVEKTDVTALAQMIIGSCDDTVKPYAPEDVNGDGRLDITDLAALIKLLKEQ
jgi:S-methylmethionine-dependent homocysteine/selenocysteine methylase